MNSFCHVPKLYYDPSIGRFISEDAHWNIENSIYGDNQKAIKYAIDGNAKIYYDKNGKNIKTEIFSQENVSINNSEQDDIQIHDIKRTPDMNVILQSFNLYVYCGNNPINHIDPSGENYALTWAGSTWWLTGVDGPFPVGDAIVVGGVIVGAIVDGVEILFYEEHTNGARPSTKNQHEKGQARKKKDAGGEKGDARRTPRKDKKK